MYARGLKKKKKKRVTDIEVPWIMRRRVDLGINKIVFFSGCSAWHVGILQSLLTGGHTCAPCIGNSVSQLLDYQRSPGISFLGIFSRKPPKEYRSSVTHKPTKGRMCES